MDKFAWVIVSLLSGTFSIANIVAYSVVLLGTPLPVPNSHFIFESGYLAFSGFMVHAMPECQRLGSGSS